MSKSGITIVGGSLDEADVHQLVNFTGDQALWKLAGNAAAVRTLALAADAGCVQTGTKALKMTGQADAGNQTVGAYAYGAVRPAVTRYRVTTVFKYPGVLSETDYIWVRPHVYDGTYHHSLAVNLASGYGVTEEIQQLNAAGAMADVSGEFPWALLTQDAWNRITIDFSIDGTPSYDRIVINGQADSNLSVGTGLRAADTSPPVMTVNLTLGVTTTERSLYVDSLVIEELD